MESSQAHKDAIKRWKLKQSQAAPQFEIPKIYIRDELNCIINPQSKYSTTLLHNREFLTGEDTKNETYPQDVDVTESCFSESNRVSSEGKHRATIPGKLNANTIQEKVGISIDNIEAKHINHGIEMELGSPHSNMISSNAKLKSTIISKHVNSRIISYLLKCCKSTDTNCLSDKLEGKSESDVSFRKRSNSLPARLIKRHSFVNEVKESGNSFSIQSNVRDEAERQFVQYSSSKGNTLSTSGIFMKDDITTTLPSDRISIQSLDNISCDGDHTVLKARSLHGDDGYPLLIPGWEYDQTVNSRYKSNAIANTSSNTQCCGCLAVCDLCDVDTNKAIDNTAISNLEPLHLEQNPEELAVGLQNFSIQSGINYLNQNSIHTNGQACVEKDVPNGETDPCLIGKTHNETIHREFSETSITTSSNHAAESIRVLQFISRDNDTSTEDNDVKDTISEPNLTDDSDKHIISCCHTTDTQDCVVSEMTQKTYDQFRTKVLSKPLPKYLRAMYFNPQVKKICIDVLEGHLTEAVNYFQKLDPCNYSRGLIDIAETGGFLFGGLQEGENLAAITSVSGSHPGDELPCIQAGSKLHVLTDWYTNQLGSSSSAAMGYEMTGTLGALLEDKNSGKEEDSDQLSNQYNVNDPDDRQTKEHFGEGNMQRFKDANNMGQLNTKKLKTVNHMKRSGVTNIEECDDTNIEISDNSNIGRSDNTNTEIFDDTNTDKSYDINKERCDTSNAERCHNTNTERSDNTKMKRSDNTKVERSDETNTEICDNTSVERTDNTYTERSDDTNTKRSDENKVERSDNTKVERSDETNTEICDNTSVERTDNTYTERSDDTNTERSDENKVERSEKTNTHRSDNTSTNVETSEVTSTERSDDTKVERSDKTDTERSDDINVETSDITNTERSDVTNTEISDITNTERSDVTNTERYKFTNTERSHVTNTEISHVTNTERSDKTNTQRTDNTSTNVETSEVTSTERSDDTKVERSDKTNTENSDDINVETSDITNTERSDDVNRESSDKMNIERCEDRNKKNDSNISKDDKNSKRQMYGLTAKHVFYKFDKENPVEMITVMKQMRGSYFAENVNIFCRLSPDGGENYTVKIGDQFYGLFSGQNCESCDLHVAQAISLMEQEKFPVLDVAVIPIPHQLREMNVVNEYFINDNGDTVNLLIFRESDSNLLNIENPKQAIEVQAIGAISGERSANNPTGATYGEIIASGMDTFYETIHLGCNAFHVVTINDRPFTEEGDSGCLITGKIGNKTEVWAYGILTSIGKKIKCRTTGVIHKNVAVCTRLNLSLDAIKSKWGINLDFIHNTMSNNCNVESACPTNLRDSLGNTLGMSESSSNITSQSKSSSNLLQMSELPANNSSIPESSGNIPTKSPDNTGKLKSASNISQMSELSIKIQGMPEPSGNTPKKAESRDVGKNSIIKLAQNKREKVMKALEEKHATGINIYNRFSEFNTQLKQTTKQKFRMPNFRLCFHWCK